jgi:hypothetical protein
MQCHAIPKVSCPSLDSTKKHSRVGVLVALSRHGGGEDDDVDDAPAVIRQPGQAKTFLKQMGSALQIPSPANGGGQGAKRFHFAPGTGHCAKQRERFGSSRFRIRVRGDLGKLDQDPGDPVLGMDASRKLQTLPSIVQARLVITMPARCQAKGETGAYPAE